MRYYVSQTVGNKASGSFCGASCSQAGDACLISNLARLTRKEKKNNFLKPEVPAAFRFIRHKHLAHITWRIFTDCSFRHVSRVNPLFASTQVQPHPKALFL